MVKLNIYTSLITSVIVQVITGIIEIASLFINIPVKFSFLKKNDVIRNICSNYRRFILYILVI